MLELAIVSIIIVITYYLRMEGISVNGKALQFLPRAVEFDSHGHGGVAISTSAPYTMLRSGGVFRPLLEAFASATKRIPRMQKVEPFELCLNSSAIGFTRVGYAVPAIDLALDGGKNWTIFGGNSMKQVGEETACLAFVDAGAKAEQEMVIGGFQMGNNFPLFDLGRRRLGFSSTLLFLRTTRGKFNFTLEA